MKKMFNNRIALLVFIVFTISSCKKNEDQPTVKNGEGFKSTTGNANGTYEDAKTDSLYPDFHLHLSADLTKEEADAQWNEALRKKLKTTGNALSGSHNQAIFYISTFTGHGTNEGTGGSVLADIEFYTEVAGGNATLFYNNLVLNNPGDDRDGGFDYYYFSETTSQAIKWLRVKKLTVRLQGTDGWYLGQLEATSNSGYYTPGIAKGSTIGEVYPYVWLDSQWPWEYDSYTMNGSASNGTGDYNKLIFN